MKNSIDSLCIILTDICQQNCWFCCHDNTYNKIGNHIELDDINSALDELDSRKLFVKITGGEPTLHPKFNDISELLHNRSFTMGITTNAQFEKETYKIIEKFYSSITIPMYGLEKTHDNLVGKQGSYNTALKSIEYFLQKRKPKTAIKFLLLPEIMDENIALVNELKKENIQPPMIIVSWLRFSIGVSESITMNESELNNFKSSFNEFITLVFDSFEKVIFEAVPLCYLTESNLLKVLEKLEWKPKNEDKYGLSTNGNLVKINKEYNQSDICSNCKLSNLCDGLFNRNFKTSSDVFPMYPII